MLTNPSCPFCGSTATVFKEKAAQWECSSCEQRFSESKAPSVRQLTDKALAPKHIFFSYGHDDNRLLVDRFQKDFEHRGHTVWVDYKRIGTWDDWRGNITRGIDESQLAVAFMSQHALRDPGVCRNEIALALSRFGNVYPIKLEVGIDPYIPVTIQHLQWPDLSQWRAIHDGQVPGVDWEHWYEERLIELVEKIEGEVSTFATDTSALREVLRPNSFESKLGQHLEYFVGREWVFEAYQHWLDERPDSRLFWIKGGPGMGKTAIAANLSVRMRGAIVAAWFCDGRSSALRSPLQAIRSLAFQWSLRWPDYRVRLLRALGIDGPCTHEQLQQLRLVLDKNKNVYDLFRQVMVEPLQNLIWREHKFVTVIDALDEATDEAGGNELVDFLAREMGSLPKWVCFVVTSRPESAVVSRLQGFKAFNIDAQDARNRQDLQTWYAQNLARRPYLICLSLAKQASIEALLLERSEGMMLYLKMVEQGLGEGSLTLDQLLDFKPGVPGLYANYASSFQHRFGPNYEATVKPLLRLLVDVDRKPVPLDLAMAVLGCDNEGLNILQLSLGSFVAESTGGLELFHKTLIDWLTRKSDNRFYIAQGTGKKLIYEALLGGHHATDEQQERWMEALFGSWLDCMNALFQSRFEQLSIVRRIRNDFEQRGATDKERVQRLLDHSDKLRSAEILAHAFIERFEPGARNLDATFGVSYLGTINWWPLAHAYFIVEKPEHALEILADVLERLRAAPGQEFVDMLCRVNIDCARVLRTLLRPTEACQRLLESLVIFDFQSIAPDVRVSELITQIYSLGLEAKPSLAMMEVYGQLLPYRLRHTVGSVWVEEAITLLLIIQGYAGQFGQALPAQFEELLLSACRTGLGLLMEAKQFERVGVWAHRCLPLYMQVFGADDSRTQGLCKIVGAQETAGESGTA